MSYTVVWEPAAEANLAELWNTASDKSALSDASNQIDDNLMRNPFGRSESRADSKRIMIVFPLAVYYRVDDLDCLVTVLAVWRV